MLHSIFGQNLTLDMFAPSHPLSSSVPLVRARLADELFELPKYWIDRLSL